MFSVFAAQLSIILAVLRLRRQAQYMRFGLLCYRKSLFFWYNTLAKATVSSEVIVVTGSTCHQLDGPTLNTALLTDIHIELFFISVNQLDGLTLNTALLTDIHIELFFIS